MSYIQTFVINFNDIKCSNNFFSYANCLWFYFIGTDKAERKNTNKLLEPKINVFHTNMSAAADAFTRFAENLGNKMLVKTNFFFLRWLWFRFVFFFFVHISFRYTELMYIRVEIIKVIMKFQYYIHRKYKYREEIPWIRPYLRVYWWISNILVKVISLSTNGWEPRQCICCCCCHRICAPSSSLPYNFGCCLCLVPSALVIFLLHRFTYIQTYCLRSGIFKGLWILKWFEWITFDKQNYDWMRGDKYRPSFTILHIIELL